MGPTSVLAGSVRVVGNKLVNQHPGSADAATLGFAQHAHSACKPLIAKIAIRRVFGFTLAQH